jgi:hypothetical protein
MKDITYTPLQLREIFHLEFLRWLAKKVKPACYGLKGGVNMRFFFGSFRYSQDMDLDIQDIKMEVLRDTVMKILELSAFGNGLKPFGIEKVVPPNIAKAKQTQTTQRFKVHLITAAGVDLFTKVECSRRGFKGKPIVEPVGRSILQQYKLTPLLVSHYDLTSAFKQKIGALAGRSVVQARDIFDLYILSSQIDLAKAAKSLSAGDKRNIKKACQNLLEISFLQFRDSVLTYLAEEDRKSYNSESVWDEVKLRVFDCLRELQNE